MEVKMEESNTQKDINEMLDSLGYVNPVKEADPNPKPEPEPELESVAEPNPEPIVDDSSEEPKGSEELEKSEGPKEDERDKTISELRKKIEEIEGKTSIKETKPEPKEDPKLDFHEFVKEDEFDEIITDRSKYNKMLNNVFEKAVTYAQRKAEENVYRAIPDIVKNNIELINTMRATSETFYSENPDLQPFKKVVAAVFEEISSQNPDKNYNELLKKVGDEARKRLELHKKATEPKQTSPKLPSKKGSIPTTPTKPDISSIQKDIDEMNKALGRY
jgi:hypothetical protein